MKSRRRAAALLAAGWALLALAWSIGNPPFAAPDEWAQYLRTLGLSEGHLLGKPARYEPAGLSRVQIRWLDYAARSVPVPRGLAPDASGCNATRPNESAACLDAAAAPPAGPRVDDVGNYEPLPYAAPAAFVRLGGSWQSADRWARIGSLLLPLACLVWAAVLAAEGGVAALAGLALGVTPMTLFVSSTVQPSGLEIAAGVLLIVALVRLRTGSSTSAWAAVGAGSALLALSRSPGPVWVVLLLLLALLLIGPRRALAAFREGGIAAWLAALAALAAIALNRVWESMWGAPVTIGLSPFPHSLVESAQQLPRVLREEVGVFDYLEWALPGPFYWGWFAAVAVLAAAAGLVGTARERLAVLASVVLAAAAPVGLYALVTRHTGFGIQGRHVLAIGAAVPIVAGAVVARHDSRLPRAALLAVGALVPLAALGQLFAWLDNAHRHAVGVGGRRLFPLSPQWSPPLGWWPWVALAALGGIVMATTALVSLLPRVASERTPAQTEGAPG